MLGIPPGFESVSCAIKNHNHCGLGSVTISMALFGTVNYLKKFLSLDLNHINRLKVPKDIEEDIESITHRLVLARLGRELKSYPFIRQMAEMI